MTVAFKLPEGRQSVADGPKLEKPVTVAIGDDAKEQLASLGITFTHPGTGNTITLNSDQTPLDVGLSLEKANNCRITIGRSAHFTSKIAIGGNDTEVCIAGAGDKQGVANFKFNINGNRCLAHIGTEFTSVGTHFILDGDDCTISVGPDCMFSWGITIHNYDHHFIFDLDSEQQVNAPKDVHIGKHVWLGQDVMLLGGASIGDGSIIGARSLVSSQIEPYSVAAGSPARVIRSNVSWGRERVCKPEHVAKAKRMLL